MLAVGLGDGSRSSLVSLAATPASSYIERHKSTNPVTVGSLLKINSQYLNHIVFYEQIEIIIYNCVNAIYIIIGYRLSPRSLWGFENRRPEAVASRA